MARMLRSRSTWQASRTRLRWQWRRIERALPESARRGMPWGTSLLAHALLLFVMAVFIRYVNHTEETELSISTSLGQLADDVTSLTPGDQAGDPFTTLQSDEPPSLPRDLTKLDDTVIAVAELPPSVRLGPVLDLTPDSILSDAGSNAAGAVFASSSPPGLSSPFTGRSGAEKARLIRREGGTLESEKAVERGLEWIARHQRPDGGWGLDTRAMCSDPPCPERESMGSDTAATGLALLPLLGAGHTHTKAGRYQQTIARGLAWLLNAQQPDGLLFLGESQHAAMYSHAIATMAICEAYALTQDKRLRAPAQRAVGYMTRVQHVQGGWRYAPMTEGDTSVHGWMLFALRSADIGKIGVPRRTIRQAARFLDKVSTDKSRSTYAYMPGHGTSHTMTAEALVCRQILGWRRDFPPLLQGAAIVAAHLEQSEERNIYYWYYGTQLLHNMRDKTWPRWNEKMRESLIATQVQGLGCDRGSWDSMTPSPDAWGKRAGRLYTTSLSLLTLEVYYRYLPLYRDQGGPIEGGDDDALADASEPAATPEVDSP